jgi:hypothetical protein
LAPRTSNRAVLASSFTDALPSRYRSLCATLTAASHREKPAQAHAERGGGAARSHRSFLWANASGPLPTVSLTFEFLRKVFPALGFWAMTLPFFFLLENFLVTLPTRQCRARILVFALASFRPMTLGTRHLMTTGFLAKVAVTEWSALIVSVQAPVPEQSPDQPVNREPEAGVALRVTEAPSSRLAVHVPPQLIPAGELVTVPVPAPAFATVSVRTRTNVAVTVVSAFRVTMQVPVPEHPPPDQPANAEPDAGVAVSVTDVPPAYENVQTVPQLTPEGFDVIDPEPLPDLAAVSLWTEHVGNLKSPIRVRQLNELVVE